MADLDLSLNIDPALKTFRDRLSRLRKLDAERAALLDQADRLDRQRAKTLEQCRSTVQEIQTICADWWADLPREKKINGALHPWPLTKTELLTIIRSLEQ